MRGKNKLADILDYVELNHDKSNFEELDESHLSELGYLFRQLDEKSLLRGELTFIKNQLFYFLPIIYIFSDFNTFKKV